MNLLFISLIDFESINDSGIYTDLLRAFVKDGHKVFIISPVEKRKKRKTYVIKKDDIVILKPQIGNIQKTSNVEKAISMITLESSLKNSIKEYFNNVKFDLVLYPTPPITFAKAIDYVKKRDHAYTYLMLKDIFPAGAVDLKALSTSGIKGIIYKYFRKKEEYLYRISDKIGCMSTGNIQYLIKHNNIDPNKVELCPNTLDPVSKRISESEKVAIRNKYVIPLDKKVFVYGGNLGKPQGIPFLIECLEAQKDNDDVFFLIIGSGTEFDMLNQFVNNNKTQNVMLKERVPKEEYDKIMASCDVGMIFLNHCFTIPNIPSRLLSYMQAGLPVIAATDTVTDLKAIIEEGNFGYWCDSNSVKGFCNMVNTIVNDDMSKLGNCSYKYLKEHYTTDISYRKILDSYNTGGSYQ